MSRLDHLIAAYRRHASIPLKQGLPIAQRVWFLVYPPEDERRLKNRLAEFEIATKDCELHWKEISLATVYADWMDSFEDEEERDAILADPEIVEDYADPGLRDHIADVIRAAVSATSKTQIDQTVFALTGLMELYDFIHVSEVLDALGKEIRGILLLFFPGEREDNTYRFLGARTGWDYLATPITLDSEA